MNRQDILARSPTVLSKEQRTFFFERGYVRLEGLIDSGWLERLRTTTAAVLERAGRLTVSDDVLDLEAEVETRRVRRLNYAADEYPEYRAFAFDSVIPDLVADVVGPDVKFRECMVNFKPPVSRDEVSWHQDLPFYPHTNTTPLLALVSLEGITPDMGPLQVIPGSHRLGLFDHYDPDGSWAGRVSDTDLEKLPIGNAVALTGAPGLVTLLHGGTVHGSGRNHSDRWRTLVVCGYSSADSFCYVPLAKASDLAWQIVRGGRAKLAHVEPQGLRIPPDFSRGYTSIVELRDTPK